MEGKPVITITDFSSRSVNRLLEIGTFVNKNFVCGILGISLSTVNSMLKRGDLPFVKLGHRVLIPRSYFDKMMEKFEGMQ